MMLVPFPSEPFWESILLAVQKLAVTSLPFSSIATKFSRSWLHAEYKMFSTSDGNIDVYVFVRFQFTFRQSWFLSTNMSKSKWQPTDLSLYISSRIVTSLHGFSLEFIRNSSHWIWLVMSLRSSGALCNFVGVWERSGINLRNYISPRWDSNHFQCPCAVQFPSHFEETKSQSSLLLPSLFYFVNWKRWYEVGRLIVITLSVMSHSPNKLADSFNLDMIVWLL